MDMISEWILFVTVDPCDLLERGIEGCKTFIMYQGQGLNKKTCHNQKLLAILSEFNSIIKVEIIVKTVGIMIPLELLTYWTEEMTGATLKTEKYVQPNV